MVFVNYCMGADHLFVFQDVFEEPFSALEREKRLHERPQRDRPKVQDHEKQVERPQGIQLLHLSEVSRDDPHQKTRKRENDPCDLPEMPGSLPEEDMIPNFLTYISKDHLRSTDHDRSLQGAWRLARGIG